MPNKNNSCVMTNINTYLRARKKFIKKHPLYIKYHKMSVEDLIRIYNAEDTPDDAKQFLLEMIYLRVFFYFPSFISKKKYKLSMILYDEALQNISKHILDAIKRFNPDKGSSFLAYAYGDIIAAMAQTFKETNTVKLPPGVGYLEYAEEEADYSNENTDINPDTVLVLKTSLFSEVDDFDVVDYDENLHKKQLTEWLEEALSEEAGVLTDDERMVVTLHNGLFGNEPMVYADIAAIRKNSGRGCSRSRISQIHTKAIAKLKKWFAEMQIED